MSTPTMQGVYVQFGEDIFHFTCDENSCQWDTLEQKLSDPVFHSVMMYLPPEYCKKPSKERNYTVLYNVLSIFKKNVYSNYQFF